MIQDRSIEILHRLDNKSMEMKANLLPQGTFGFPFLPHGIEQGTAELLDLVDQECQHNQVNKYFAQMLLAQPVVVTKIIPLILQGVERLIFYFPPGTGTTHEQVQVVLGDIQIGNPAEMLNFSCFGIFFPVLDKGHPAVLI